MRIGPTAEMTAKSHGRTTGKPACARRRADFRERNGRAQGAISPGTGSGSTKLPTATPTAPTAPPPPAASTWKSCSANASTRRSKEASKPSSSARSPWGAWPSRWLPSTSRQLAATSLRSDPSGREGVLLQTERA